MFIEDYIAEAGENGVLDDLPDYPEYPGHPERPGRNGRKNAGGRSSQDVPDDTNTTPRRRSNLRQGDIEITDFSQLEDDDL